MQTRLLNFNLIKFINSYALIEATDPVNPISIFKGVFDYCI